MKRRSALIGIIIVIIIGFFVLRTVQREPVGKMISKIAFQKGKIGIVEIKGIIMDSEYAIRDINQFKEDDSIQAIVVRIDSPGGAVGPSQEVYEELAKLSNEKIVVASMGSVGASGAYYIACGAQKIVANPGTITGSIGVIMEYVEIKDLLKWAKVEPVVIKSGEFKDAGSPFREMKESERRYLQSLINNVHSQFIRAVSDGRKLPLTEVKALADGRIFSGEIAKELGLVDELGNFQDAIDLAANLANIEGKPELMYPMRKKFRVFEKFVDNLNRLLVGREQVLRGLTLNYILHY